MATATAATALLVIYLHGHGGSVYDSVKRQRVQEQVPAGMRLLIPSLGPRSEPGALVHPDGLDTLIQTRFPVPGADRMPIVLVAYSGGGGVASPLLRFSNARDRVAGVVLLDALYGDWHQNIVQWKKREHPAGFIVSAFTPSTRPGNIELAKALPNANILPDRIRPGDVVILPGLAVPHRSFVTKAWTDMPIADVLKRLGESE